MADYLNTGEGTADIGARLMKKAVDKIDPYIGNVTDRNERSALRTNAWREKTDDVIGRIENKKSKNPSHVPSSDNNSACLNKRMDAIDKILSDCGK
jgi:hypothetical protein